MSSHLSDAERSLIGSLAAHESWARTTDRAARTAPARAALEKKFLDEAGGDPERADHLRRAYYLRLALKSAQSRRQKATCVGLESCIAGELLAGDLEVE